MTSALTLHRKLNAMREELLQFATAWDKAMENNDADEIGAFMHEDWVCIGSNGPTTKSSFLDTIRSGVLQHSEMTMENPEIKIYENTGVLYSRGISAGTWQGQAFRLDEWQTSVFVKENGNWLCVCTMLTPAVENK
jgi:ketosteroid isomerase-like protein